MAKLSDLPIGAKVKDLNTKFNGRVITWIVADKNHKGYPNNTVTLISERIFSISRDTGSEAYYRKSELRKWINDKNGLMKYFSHRFSDSIVDTRISTNYNGSGDSVTDKVFLPSPTEVGVYFGVSTDSSFPIFNGDDNSRRAKNFNNSYNAWVLRYSQNYYVYIADDSGQVRDCPIYNCSFSVRPLCNLKSDIKVNKDSDGSYTIVWNQPPSIESSTGASMGLKSKEFSFAYKVTELDYGQTLTVEEYIDNTRIKRFSANSGSTYTFNLSRLAYQKLSNGNHKIKIIATDSEGGVAEKEFNFSKNETKILFTLEQPLEADAMVTRAMINVIGSIPSGAILKVEACNNGHDSNPTWEDCTKQTLGQKKIFLKNKQKTASKWGFNVRVSVNRNGAEGECYISSIGGNFE